MPITAKQETGAAYDFRVNQVEFKNPVTGDKTGLFANIRQDNNDILGVVSKRYSIVNNKDITDRADSALEAAGMPYKRKVYTLEGGRKMKAYYDIGVDDEGKVINESMTRKVAKGDIMGFRLIAQNSFDRTLRVSFALGLIRLVCTNGMTTMEKEISMIKKHSASFNLDDFISRKKFVSTILHSLRSHFFINFLNKSLNHYKQIPDIISP